MKAANRVTLNTIATYSRSLFSVGLALFSSRWVLGALGQADFGLFSLVGSVILFITFLNQVMASSVSRHYAYSIGKGGAEDLAKWFNTALGLHVCLAVVLVAAGWPIGEYCVRHVFTIPGDRMDTCVSVFRISLVSAFASMISIPFVGMFTARQRISEIAFWGVWRAVLTFVLAFVLTKISVNHLLIYAVGMVGIIVLIEFTIIGRAFYVFEECCIRPCFLFSRSRSRHIISFASWSLIGSSGAIFRDQGSAILLNMHFGPSANAAYGIAKQVSNQTTQLCVAMLEAVAPEIITREGRGERGRMLSLAHQSSKFGTILIMLFAIPLVIEMDYVLKLWLKIPPPFTSRFCQLILIAFLIDRLTVGYMLAVNAKGRIAAYQATVGGMLVLTLPLGWVFLKQGYPQTTIGVAFIVTAMACSVIRIFWLRHFFNEPIWCCVRFVLAPCLAVGVLSAIATLSVCWFLPSTLLRLVLSLAVNIVTVCITSWAWALNREERCFVLQSTLNATRKILFAKEPR